MEIQPIAISKTLVVGLSRINDVRASLAAENLKGEMLGVSSGSVLVSRRYGVRLG